MAGGSKVKPNAHSILPSKLSLPAAIALCSLTFYGGFLLGGRPLESMPDIRTPSKSSKVNAKEAVSVAESAEPNLERDFLAKIQPSEHGETGRSEIDLIPFQVLSWQPRAFFFPGFVPHDRCDEIVKIAKKRLSPSGLALRPGETYESNKNVRTSSGTFLQSSPGDLNSSLTWIENKVARLTMIPASHGEAYNVLRYEEGQKYDSHFDTFDPKDYGPQKSNRVASFLIYLSDWEEGGETMFPYEGYKNMKSDYNFQDCIGLKVKPKKGDGLLFWSMTPNGTIDPTALHGSCPIIKGVKFVATKWIRNLPMHLW